MLPAMIFTSVTNANIPLDLWRVAAASVVTHTFVVAIVIGFSRFVSQENGLRGQWMMCLTGCNIGFTYPILLSVPSLAETIFPVVLVWDLAGNLWCVMVVNYVVGIQYSPLHEDTQPLTDQISDHQTSENSPSTIGAVSEIDVSLGPDSPGVEGCAGSHDNEAQDARSNRSAVSKSMIRSSSALFAASA